MAGMPSFNAEDERLMRQALELARRGIALASPNPCVGAVIVNPQGEVIGAGSYAYARVKHAEVLALEQAGARARGAAIYLNLEPHGHQGRTPPCTDALIAAGVRRVVAAMADPNPQVAGQGFAQLRSAGIVVETGLLESEARKLNEAFARYILRRRPLVTVKSGMTLDGKIAPPPLETRADTSSIRITGAEAHAHVQDLRHASDAILAGIGTVIADDPLLTDRSGLPRRRPLLRVVLDSRLRLPLESKLVQTARNDLLIFCSSAPVDKRKALVDHGVQVEEAPSLPGGRLDLAGIVQRLGEMQMTSLLIEGGSLVNWTALSTGIADKVFLYYAPIILGGTRSIPLAGGAGFPGMAEAAQVKDIALHRFGDGFAVEGYLRDPYDAP